MMWIKNQFFKNGISPNDFRKCQMRDILDILEIESEIEEKQKREQEVQNLINKMK